MLSDKTHAVFHGLKSGVAKSRSSYFATLALACVALFSFGAPSVKAANFTSGNLAVIVAASATANNTTASVIELSSSTASQSSPVQTISIDGNSYRVSGSATSTLYLANSADGSLIALTAQKGASTTSGSNANTLTSRGVVTINNAATVANPASWTGTSGQQTRGASSLNNTTWFIGDQNGFYTDGATSASPSGNVRGIKSFGSVVYAMTSTTTTPFVGIISAATGGTYTALTGLPNGTTAGQDFYLIQSGSNGTTYDVLYILSATSATAGTIAKYSLVSGTWTANGTYTTTFGGFGLAAKKSGSGADLFVTSGTGATAANVLYKLTDTAGFNASIAITTANNVSLYTTAAGTTMKGVAFAPVAAAATTFTVTYNANNGTGTQTDSTAYSSGASVTVKDQGSMARTGYTFNGWNTAADGTGISYAASGTFSISANTTLFAKWTANALAVTYNSQGGTAISNGSTTTGGSISTSPGTPTRTGYTFNGWFVAASGGTALTFPYTHAQTADFSLYAQWTANTLTVTYDSQSGSAISNGSTTTGGTIATSPGTPTRATYTFNGWFAAASGGTAIGFPYTHNQTANFTLYAQWSQVPGLIAVTLGSGLTGTYPSASSGVSFTATGSNLTAAQITATAQTGYEVSSDNSTYGSSVSVAKDATVWIRLAASQNAGSYNAATAAVLSGGGAASPVNVTTSSSGNTISKATPSIITAPTATAISYGQTLANSTLSGGSASVAGTFAFTTPSTAPTGGTADQIVTFTPTATANYNTVPTTASVTVNKVDPTITFGALSNRNYGEVFALTATTSSGLTVSYSSSDTTVATVSGSSVTAVGLGTVTITASVTGNGNYNAASASQSLTVVQGPFVSWTFESTLTPVVGSGTAALIGSTTSTYATGVAGNGLNTTTYPAASTGSGTAGVKFTVPTSGTSVSATGIIIGLDFRQSATASKYWQLQLSEDGINFVNASGGTAAIASGQNSANTETAFSNDGLYVNNPGSGSQQFVTGITYTLTGTAASTYINNPNFAWRWVSVFSPSGSSYAAANSTYGSTGTARFDNVYVQYLKQNSQTITFDSLSAKTYGDAALNLTATASSGLSVTYVSSDTSVATISGSTVTILKAGSTVITASQAGNSSYAAATPVSQTLTVGKAAQTITLAATDSKTYGGIYMDFDLTLTKGASSSALSYSSSNTSVATIDPTTGSVHVVGAGTTTLTVNQAADANYYAAPAVTQILTVSKAAITVTAAAKTKTYGAADPGLTYTITSGALVVGDSLTGGLSRAPGANVGTYAISSTLSNANYDVTFVPANLTITAATVASSDITMTPAGDGSYTASATSGASFTYSYAGRNQTSYGPSATAPTGAGFYSVTATATGNYSGSNSADFSITGPMAIADSLTKPADNEPYMIPVSELLTNDFRITSTSGATVTTGLSVSAVTGGAGNTASYNVGDRFISSLLPVGPVTPLPTR